MAETNFSPRPGEVFEVTALRVNLFRSINLPGYVIGDIAITATGATYEWDGDSWNSISFGAGGGGAQTPWASNINGGGFNLTNVGSIAINTLGGGYTLVSNLSGEVVESLVSDVELGYLTGVTSAIQTQLNAKAGLGANTFTALQTITQASANTGILASTGYSLTGSNATSMIDLAGTTNTTGTPTLFKLNWTDTASNAASLLADFQVGGASRFKVGKDGTAIAFNRVIVSPTGNAYSVDSGISETGPALYIARSISGGSVNEHGIIDRTSFNNSTFAYAAFDAQASTPNNANSFNHYAGFQQRGSFNGTGTLSNYYSFSSVPVVSHVSGVVTNLYHFSNVVANTVDGTIGTEYGLYIKALNGTTKWGVYIVSDQVFFGGNTKLGNHLLFTVASKNIGESGFTNSPANIYVSNDGIFGGNLQIAAGQLFRFNTRGIIIANADGVFQIANNGVSDFGRLQFGGTTSSFPAWKRSAAQLHCRLADDSADAVFQALQINVAGTQVLSARRTGWSAATGGATRTTFDTTTVTLPQLAERMKALVDDFLVHGAIGA